MSNELDIITIGDGGDNYGEYGRCGQLADGTGAD